MKKNKINMEKRATLIKELSTNIIESAQDIVKETDQVPDKKIFSEVKDRLSYEASSLLNEVVTKLSPTITDLMAKEKAEERRFLRFGWNFRLQHMLMFASVIILIITGMPLKFPEFAISKFVIIKIFGGLQGSTTVHRVGAVGLTIVGVWHVFYIIFSKMGRRDFFLMIPRPQDIKDFFQTIFYFIGRKSHGPKFGRFSFIEKFDYWAVYWGMVIMIGSGAVMWFKEIFPKYFYDIGREMHSDEGLLATLAIVIWHFYNVHFNPEVFPMSWIWWHGELTESEMKHHHPLEYNEIMKKESQPIIEKDKQDLKEAN